MLQRLLNLDISWYVVALLGSLLLAVSAVAYTQNLKIDKYKAQVLSNQIALQTSEASIQTLKAEINKSVEAWKAKAELDAQKVQETQKLLKDAENKNKSLLDLAKKLRSNKSGNTPIPEDIKDAWHSF